MMISHGSVAPSRPEPDVGRAARGTSPHVAFACSSPPQNIALEAAQLKYVLRSGASGQSPSRLSIPPEAATGKGPISPLRAEVIALKSQLLFERHQRKRNIDAIRRLNEKLLAQSLTQATVCSNSRLA